jgi:hypothetical protein
LENSGKFWGHNTYLPTPPVRIKYCVPGTHRRDEAAFLENNPMGGDLDLTINGVIVPYIRHAVEFVDEAVKALKQAAGKFLRLTKGGGVTGT